MLKEMNEFYNEIVQKKVSLDEGVKNIIAYIYMNPHIFGLVHIDADLKSNIIVKLLECLPRYIANYSDSKSFFSTYLCSIILNLLRSEYRNFYCKKAHESTILYYLKQHTMHAEEVYESVYAEKECGYVCEQCNGDKTSVHTEGCTNLPATHMLILALKACYFLNEKHILRLSKITGRSEDEIYDYKQKLEASMHKRLQVFKDRQYRLNTCYMMKNRCFLQLMTMPPDSTLFNRMFKHYTYYAQKWKSKLHTIRSRSSLRPTNDEIAKVLHIQPHQVYQALRYIRSVGTSKA